MARSNPERIGRYEILEELGRGSMGCVYLARDPNIDRRVAVKVLEPVPGISGEEEEELRRRFVLEARAAGRVSHPGIVTVHDAQTDAESATSFIAMEWVDGTSLESLFEASAPLPVERAVDLVSQVAIALDAAHREGLVHRDVKPANLLLDRSGRVKISDFGIAKFTSMSQTKAGRILGSPFYMSPEQVRSEPVDRRSDLFSLGVVLYQALTGVVPFGGDSLAGITYKILEIDPRPVRSINPEVPEAVAAVLDRALQKSPADRFQSGLELARALEEAMGRRAEGDGEATVVLTPERAGRRRRWGAVAVVSALLLAALVWALRTGAGPVAEPELAVGAAAGVSGEVDADGEGAAPPPRSDVPGEGETAPGSRDGESEPDPASAAGASRPRPKTAGGAGPDLVATPPAASDRGSPEESAATASEEPEPEPDPESESPPPGASERRSTRPDRSSEPARSSALEVTYSNHLRSAVMTITVDDRRAWSRRIAARGLVARTLGSTVRARISMPTGKHVVGVEIEGSEGKVHATKRIWGTFEGGTTRRLRVVLVPPSVLRLSWKE